MTIWIPPTLNYSLTVYIILFIFLIKLEMNVDDGKCDQTRIFILFLTNNFLIIIFYFRKHLTYNKFWFGFKTWLTNGYILSIWWWNNYIIIWFTPFVSGVKLLIIIFFRQNIVSMDKIEPYRFALGVMLSSKFISSPNMSKKTTKIE